MPRFFFHVFDGVEHLDETGVELADLASARKEASQTMSEMIRDLDGGVEAAGLLTVRIVDEAGEEHGTMKLTIEVPKEIWQQHH